MSLLKDLNSGKYNLILILIISVFIFHQYWCKFNSNKESMTDINSIKSIIDSIYKADIEAIRTLADTSKKLQEGKYTVSGNLTVLGSFNYLPKGTIVAYAYPTAPQGWAICNGQNGTPNLTNRFIYGAGNRKINDTGGIEMVTLNLDQIPSHKHGMKSAGKHKHKINSDWKVWPPGTYNTHCAGGNITTGDRAAQSFKRLSDISTFEDGEHKHSIINTGGSQAHENMPPFYVLTYIMKL